MSTSTYLNDYLVQIPDRPDALQTRTSNVAAHVSHNRAHIEAGRIVMSGPTLAAEPPSPSPSQPEQGNQQEVNMIPITGSVMVFRAATGRDVRQMLAEDPYAKIGVWDLENAAVTLFRCVVRKQL